MTLEALLAVGLAAGPLLPGDGGALFPAQLELKEVHIPPASHRDASDCGTCHPDVAAQWRSSAHALASFTNPLYRVAVERLARERGHRATRMCAACHDPALLAAGLMDEGEVAADDARAHAGISCTTCHSAVHARLDGNGSLTLGLTEALPSRPEDSTLEAHRRRVAPPLLRTAQLCAGCHRAFLDGSTGNGVALGGMDDHGSWQRSAYAGSTAERVDAVPLKDCRGCHMAPEPAVLGDVAATEGMVASHRFLGAHTALAAMRGDGDTLARVQAFLRDSVEIDVAAARVGDGPWHFPAHTARPVPGQRLQLDVVLFNRAVGHTFPGGVLDNQGTRVELTVRTATGRLLARHTRHQLRSEVVDARGRPLHTRETHAFVATAWNHTVGPRDARAVRYELEVPTSAELPLEVHAELVHVARLDELVALACADAATPRGQAFMAAGAHVTGAAVDPCVPQPRTVMGSSTVMLGPHGGGVPAGGGRAGATPPHWERTYRRGLALSHGLQEHLDEAVDALEAAAARATTSGERERTAAALAAVAGKRGQLARALELTSRLPGSAVRHTLTARALAQVWRWPEAAEAFATAAALAPGDVTLWQGLAMARASAGDAPGALHAARQGLALSPRDPDCLRVQALALQRLGLDDTRAMAAALQWRVPDEAPAARSRCSATVELCAARRNPVPVYTVGEGTR